METALLRGRDHTLEGVIAAIAEGAVGIALSRGGAKKPYAYKEPNEDAVGFARGAGGTLLVLADGHSGTEASEEVVSRMLEDHGPRWTGEGVALAQSWEGEAREAIFEAHDAAVARAALAGAGDARTTLALCVVRPGDRLFAWASVGDSHVFHVGEHEIVELSSGETVFLGHPADDREALAARCIAGCENLDGTRAIALASDGISEPGIGCDNPEATLAEQVVRAAKEDPELRPLTLARSLVEEALAAHRAHRAGDNIACAAYVSP